MARKDLPFEDVSRPIQDRVEDLLQRLSLVEKVHQLMHDAPPIERLGIPGYNWWNEACHGVGRAGSATVFPQVIGLAATWNRVLLNAVGAAISDEARAKHEMAAARGWGGQYRGLTFWTPNINIFRDPRWGRGQETFGEDPYLTGELGVALVRGLQGSNPDRLKVAACAKHFAVHSGPECQRHTFDAMPSKKDLRETYLPAFEKLVRHGVEAVMGAYNRLYGKPCCGSQWLLGQVLREEWRFAGHVVSDCGAIADFHTHHDVTTDGAASAALALKSGCDLNCGCTYGDLLVAHQQGLISEHDLDRALRRLLTTRIKLGFFDPKPTVPAPTKLLDHRSLARQTATESVVLLSNRNQTLPLAADCDYILVTGPNAASVSVLLGNYHGLNSEMVTLLEGLVARVACTTRVEFRLGCQVAQASPPGENWTFNEASRADVVVAVLGLDPSMEGEEGDAVASAHAGDRARIELPEHQRDFLRQLRAKARKLVLVLTGGSPIAVSEAHEVCDAVLQVWYPGCEGGRAVAAVLFGDVNPSGKLPVTVPRCTEDLPDFADYNMGARTYRFAVVEPLYPFGFGLSYTRFEFRDLRISSRYLTHTDELTVTVAVHNVGDRIGQETVQCYLVPPRWLPTAPRASLIGFEKMTVPAGQHIDVAFSFQSRDFLQVDEAGERLWVEGRYEIWVSAASPGPRASALGAAIPVVAELILTA